MALLDKSKASFAFKTLLGKAHTSNTNELANEAIASGLTISASRIFADTIQTTPTDPLNSGIVSDELILTLEAIAGSDTNQIGTPRAYRTKLAGSVPASLVGKINPLTNAAYAPNDYIGGLIPQSFGNLFRPKLYSDAAATVEIPPSSAADWFIDCFAGIVTQEGQDEGASGFTLGANGRVRAFVYIGRYLTEALEGGGASGGGSIGEWQNSVRGFSQDLIGGTNAFFNFYEDVDLTIPIDQALLTSGLRWIHIGSTVPGLNIYDPVTNTFSTGNVTNNDIVEYYVSNGTSGSVGYIVYTPSAGTFTSFDENLEGVYRFTGSIWIEQDFGSTASNGLTKVGTDIQLGGLLTGNVLIDGAFDVAFGSSTPLDNFSIDSLTVELVSTNGSGPKVELGVGGDNWTIGAPSMDIVGNGTTNVLSVNGLRTGLELNGTGITMDAANSIVIDSGGGTGIELIAITNITFSADSAGSTMALNTGGTFDLVLPDSEMHFNSGGQVQINNNTYGITLDFSGALKYDANYSNDFTNRSLVDKEYVDTAIANGAFNLVDGNGTIIGGNSTSGQSINLGGSLTEDVTIDGAQAYGFYLDNLLGYQISAFDGINNVYISADVDDLYKLTLAASDGTDTSLINMSATAGIEVSDSSEIGLKYAANYSLNFTDRSLVDKEYVDSAVASASVNLLDGSGTTVGGNSTAGYFTDLGGILTKDTVLYTETFDNVVVNRGGIQSFKFDTGLFEVKHAPFGYVATYEAVVATNSNITLSGLQTIDTYEISDGDIVLVKNQSDDVENGLWIASTGSWARGTDVNFSETVKVLNGNDGVLTFWIQNSFPTYGVDPVTFDQDTNAIEAILNFNSQGTFNLSNSQSSTTVISDTINLNAGDGKALNLISSWARLVSQGGATNRVLLETTLLKFDLNETGDSFLVTDNRVGAAANGLEYAANYSAGFTNRSLVDKEYVDNVASGLDPKGSVRATTTADITLSGLQTIDGVSLANGNRVLVKDQTTASQNGVYIVAAGAWSRSSDFDTNSEVTAGAYFFVEEGTLYADTGWVLSTNNPIVVGTTSLEFVQFSAAGVLVASNGLTKVGQNLELGGALLNDTTINGAFALNLGTGSPLTALNVVAQEFVIDSQSIQLVNSLNSSTAGYDVIVRNITTGELEKVSGSAFTGSVPTINDKNLVPIAGTNGNGTPTNLTISSTPTANGYVQVEVNGVGIVLGTSNASGSGYFAQPGSGGSIGRALNEIQSGDEFYWNSTVAGYSLDTFDRIDFLYNVAS